MSEPSFPDLLAMSISELRIEFENSLRILEKLEHQLTDLPGTPHTTERMEALTVMVQYVTQLATSNVTVRAEVAEAAWHLEQLLGQRTS